MAQRANGRQKIIQFALVYLPVNKGFTIFRLSPGQAPRNSLD